MYLDHTNPDSIANTIRKVRADLAEIRRVAAKYGDPIDVRLVANADGECWFATGDVQYDTEHGAACEAATVSPNSDDDELADSARDLVEGVADQLAEGE